MGRLQLLAAVAGMSMLVGCGAVTIHVIPGGSGGSGDLDIVLSPPPPSVGYYHVPDNRAGNWWYYHDGSSWRYYDDGYWRVDAGFVWRADYDHTYYNYNPIWYADQYDPVWDPYYDDPYYWDEWYYYDDGYYGDEWYDDGYGDEWYDDGYYYDDGGWLVQKGRGGGC